MLRILILQKWCRSCFKTKWSVDIHTILNNIITSSCVFPPKAGLTRHAIQSFLFWTSLFISWFSIRVSSTTWSFNRPLFGFPFTSPSSDSASHYLVLATHNVPTNFSSYGYATWWIITTAYSCVVHNSDTSTALSSVPRKQKGNITTKNSHILFAIGSCLPILLTVACLLYTSRCV